MESDSEVLLSVTVRTELSFTEMRKEQQIRGKWVEELSSLVDVALLTLRSLIDSQVEMSNWQLVVTAWSSGRKSKLKK